MPEPQLDVAIPHVGEWQNSGVRSDAVSNVQLSEQLAELQHQHNLKIQEVEQLQSQVQRLCSLHLEHEVTASWNQSKVGPYA